MTDRNMNNVSASQFNERRMSLTQRLIGNARDWFQGPKEAQDFSKAFGENANTTTIDEHRVPMRQRSKSIGYFCEKRDIIIPGPVF